MLTKSALGFESSLPSQNTIPLPVRDTSSFLHNLKHTCHYTSGGARTSPDRADDLRGADEGRARGREGQQAQEAGRQERRLGGGSYQRSVFILRLELSAILVGWVAKVF